MQPQFEIPTTDPSDLGEFDELYRLHVRYFRAAQDDVRRQFRPGREQDAQLAYCETLTREYFELKLEALQDDPQRYGWLVQELRRGYSA